jgi:radical SAM protein with 4Fe4S-binding SPASM domain
MINLTSLYGGIVQPMDAHRYGRGHGAPRAASERRPVVVWNLTRRCNLRCLHCYADSEPKAYEGELTLSECGAVIDDLAEYGIPVLLMSGGEPLTHPHFHDIARRARQRGLRLVLSTNGTLIDQRTALELKLLGFSYVGISLDGSRETHDTFRCRSGAYDRVLEAFAHCRSVGQKAGLRLTLSRSTIRDLPHVLDLIEQMEIERVCFYHLVWSGRGSALESPTPGETRRALDLILDRTRRWVEEGSTREVLTVDQPADAAYVLMRMERERNPRVEEVRERMEWNGGGAHSSGVGIGNIDPQGDVHPDQFWRSVTLGNVRQLPFSRIWSGSDHPVLAGLRDRLPLLKGRCGSCRFQRVCGGGFRVRAEQRFGDPWQEDPGCYLSSREIGADLPV